MMISDLEKRVREEQKFIVKILKAADYITKKLGSTYEYSDRSGSMEIEDFYGFRIEISGVPIKIHSNIFGINPVEIERRTYKITGQRNKFPYYAFEAEYEGSMNNVVVKYRYDEALRGFFDIAEHPREYVWRHYLADVKSRIESGIYRWKNREEINKERKRERLFERAKALRIEIHS